MLDQGVRAGFEHLGYGLNTVAYAEWEGPAASQLLTLMEAGALDEAPVWCGDMRNLDAGQFRGVVDCIIAGFPCQDISIAGRRAGLDGQRSGLFFDILDIADACQARGIVLENVAAIATATATAVDEAEGVLEERAAARVVGELADRGWDAEWITLSASDVGASHGRARWFCLAWRRAMGHAGLHARGAQHGQQPQGPTGGLGQPGADGDSGSVADAGHRARTHEPIGIAGSGGPTNDSPGGQAVGSAERPRWPQTGGGSEIHPGRELEPRCSDVDDTQRVELAGQRIHARPGPAGDGAPDTDRPGAAAAHTSQPRLQNAEQPEPAGAWPGLEWRAAHELRGAPLFAPGPLDPRWAGIVQAAPWLAPAIADPSEPDKRRLNPRFAEWLMGWPIGWTENLNAKNTITCPGDQPGSHSQESAASRTGQWRALLQMRLKELVAAPSRGLQQANGCDASLRCLSSQGAHPTAGELLDLRDGLSTQEDKAINAMRKPRMLEDHGAVECGKALENRAHRLRQVGNGVVPAQAGCALVELVRRAAWS